MYNVAVQKAMWIADICSLWPNNVHGRYSEEIVLTGAIILMNRSIDWYRFIMILNINMDKT